MAGVTLDMPYFSVPECNFNATAASTHVTGSVFHFLVIMVLGLGQWSILTAGINKPFRVHLTGKCLLIDVFMIRFRT
jgi:hypothetical protein